MFEIKITASTADELIAALDSWQDAIAGRKPSVAADQSAAEDAPKATRKRANAKADGASDAGAASSSTPNATALEPDEGNAVAGAAETDASDAASSTTTSNSTAPSRDDVLTAATKFSQAHGADALMQALKDVGAAKFSEVLPEKYQEFIDVMGAFKADPLS